MQAAVATAATAEDWQLRGLLGSPTDSSKCVNVERVTTAFADAAAPKQRWELYGHGTAATAVPTGTGCSVTAQAVQHQGVWRQQIEQEEMT
ncbi:hypothetical protein cyc_06717 [Cyclospora cayetanensis]|uniref:Uncharacterized protein n=1 Tax=Cyclospora cayetanensis TaxID=88456 RepID=A0A1D3D1F5_9EIME|nr:hypothetical protein cyc_06717 [Cyclospora cayetanensis]